MRILITGAFGFIGRHLLSALLAEPGTEVFLLDRQKPDSLSLVTGDPTQVPAGIIEADLRDLDQTRRSVANIQPDLVFHLAAAGVGDPFLDVELAISHNLRGTINLLQALLAGRTTTHRPQKVIISRTPGEYSAMNPYAASKAAAWQFCRMYARTKGWPIVGGAVFQAYGPGQPAQRLLPAAILAALNDEDFPMTAGQQQKDWIFVADIVSGFLAIRDAELSPGTTIELGTGKLTSVADVVRQVYEIIGGSGHALFGALASRPGEVPKQLADITQSYELTNWRPKMSLQAGLMKTIDVLRNPQNRQS
jgi:nucleoside-diphosphate-sugar epimerase